MKTSSALTKSFACAINGIVSAVKSERNLRLHLAAGACLFWFVRYYSLSRAELALLILTVALVITSELINTAIEKTVDIETQSFHPLARFAKDVAAGAVLVASIASLAVGYLLLWDVDVLRTILSDILAAPVPWLFAVALMIFWISPFGRSEKR